MVLKQTKSRKEPPFLPEKKKVNLPLLPLRDIVIYPHTIIPLSVTGSKAITAIEKSIQQSRIISVVAIKPEDASKKDSELLREDFFNFGKPFFGN